MSKNKELLPDFLIIGAGKSGTTSLDNYLKQHPEIFMSPVKEPNFFAYENIDINQLYPEARHHYHQSVTDLTSYQELFNKAGEGDLLGETSNTYLVVEGSAENIKRHIPGVKLIAILRQPTDRLYSRYLHLAREGELPSENFEDVLDKDSIWWVRNDLVIEGLYYKNLSRFFNLFGKEQIKVIIYDDFRKDPGSVLDEIFDFLEVDRINNLDFSISYNKSGFIKNKMYDRILGHNSVLIKTAKKVIPTRLFSKVKKSLHIQKLISNVRDYNLSQPKLNPELRAEITDKIYKEDIIQLGKLLNRDLSYWFD